MDPDHSMGCDFALAPDPCVRSWQLGAATPMATLDQLRVLSTHDSDERLRLIPEICCERYGDLTRQLDSER
jgi:hypothetical protein